MAGLLGTLVRSATISLWIGTALFLFSELACANGVLLVGGTLTGVMDIAVVGSPIARLGVVACAVVFSALTGDAFRVGWNHLP